MQGKCLSTNTKDKNLYQLRNFDAPQVPLQLGTPSNQPFDQLRNPDQLHEHLQVEQRK